ncbi:MAG: hypothetical protein VXV96_10880 [Bdellovibrionota bacterium]|nr:hypothetical protein [Bdellovibrionota bacterium]
MNFRSKYNTFFFIVMVATASSGIQAQIMNTTGKQLQVNNSQILGSSLTKIFSPMGSTSFGGLDCGYYNAKALPVYSQFGIKQADCMSLAGGISAATSFPNATVQATGLGEQEVLSYGEPKGRFKNYLKNPYEAVNYIDIMTDSPTGESCPAGFYESGDDGYRSRSGDTPQYALTDEERAMLNFDLGPRPDWVPINEEGPLVELPSPKDYDEVRNGSMGEFEMEKDIGYYRYGDGDGNVFGSERTVWNIKAAGKILSEKGIIMGVGEISSKAGPTSGHSEHQEGRDVDLRLIGKTQDGVARAERCNVNNSGCYDRDNTYEMIKAFIDVDPYGIDKVFINDPKLRTMINDYMSSEYGVSQTIAKSCSGHDDHIHLSFKRNGKDPDSY